MANNQKRKRQPMKILSRLTLILAIILMFGMFAMTSYAQDDNSVPLADSPSDPAQGVLETDTYVKPEEIANGLESFLNEHMAIPSLSALVLVLTAASKYIVPEKVPSKSISFFWVIVTYGAYVIAVNWGYTVELENAANLITKLGVSCSAQLVRRYFLIMAIRLRSRQVYQSSERRANRQADKRLNFQRVLS